MKKSGDIMYQIINIKPPKYILDEQGMGNFLKWQNTLLDLA